MGLVHEKLHALVSVHLGQQSAENEVFQVCIIESQSKIPQECGKNSFSNEIWKYCEQHSTVE